MFTGVCFALVNCFSTRLMIKRSSSDTSTTMAGISCCPSDMKASSRPWPQTSSYVASSFDVLQKLTVIGFFSPTLEMLSTIWRKTFLLRSRGLRTVMRSTGIISTLGISWFLVMLQSPIFLPALPWRRKSPGSQIGTHPA